MAPVSAWLQPTDLGVSFRACNKTGQKSARDAFDAYQDHRNMEGAVATSNYWQTAGCEQEGFQASREGKQQPNVYCKILPPSVAGWERQQQILDAMVERQFDMPPAVLEGLGRGLDVDEAYAQAGVAPPLEGLIAPTPARQQSVRATAGARGHSMRAVSGAALGIAGSHVNSLSVGAAFSGGKVLSTLEMPGTAAYSTAGSPANMAEPGKQPQAGKGARIYTRQHESGSGKTTYATTYLGGGAAAAAAAYTQPTAAGGTMTPEFRARY